jgi:hypothetical protein
MIFSHQPDSSVPPVFWSLPLGEIRRRWVAGWQGKQLLISKLLAVALNLSRIDRESALEDKIVDEFSSKKNGNGNQCDSHYVLQMVT